jgi:phosphodiesterase/alkaline phosphatase D-like protein
MTRRLIVLVVAAIAAILAAATIAMAASAPTATTAPAGGITDTSAELHGTVNPNGQETTYTFEYGTTTSYGQSTVVGAAGGGTTDVAVSSSVSGLTANTTYHYRIVATNPSGTTDGADATFTTTGKPGATTAAATNVGTTTVTLNGTVNPSGEATTYSFQYGTTTGYGRQTSAQSAGAGTTDQGVSANVSSLTPGTTYHYRLVATNGSGTTNGSDMTFTTSGTAPTRPAVVTGSATSVVLDGATLNGSVTPNGATTTWTFEFGLTTQYGVETKPRRMSATTSSAGVSATLSGLEPGRTYHYRLVGSNSKGTTNGQDMTFTTPPAAAPVNRRSLPLQVTAKTRKARARNGRIVFTTSGRVVPPPGVSGAHPCTGEVLVRFQGGRGFRRTLSIRYVALRANCTYSSKTSFRPGRGKMRVRVRFQGSSDLKPMYGPTQVVRA